MRKMKNYTFKTNLQCTNCRAKVAPLLDKSDQIQDWKLDLEDPERRLRVAFSGDNPQDIIHLVNKVGFKAELDEALSES
jgi:copper chaperone